MMLNPLPVFPLQTNLNLKKFPQTYISQRLPEQKPIAINLFSVLFKEPIARKQIKTNQKGYLLA